MLDILGDYLTLQNHCYLRLDGDVPMFQRQKLIDDFNLP